jgi:hypothetical protein
MPLGDNEILQISATVIAGALIFVSFVGIKDMPSLPRIMILSMIILMIEPFALASLQALSNKTKRATYFLRLGFVFVMILTAAIGAVIITFTPTTTLSPDA